MADTSKAKICNRLYQNSNCVSDILPNNSVHLCRLEELNLSWCDFTATHVKAAVTHVTSKVTQLNLSGYRQNLQISGKLQHGKLIPLWDKTAGFKFWVFFWLAPAVCIERSCTNTDFVVLAVRVSYSRLWLSHEG